MATDYASLLNPRQLEAVTTDAPFLRIIAGAGSGKTRVLTYRIAYLLEEKHIDPYSLLAVTFTNKAAREMKERVNKLVPGVAPYLQVSTFHSFCAKLLRREAHRFSYPAGFTIFDEDDQEKLVKDIALDKGLKKGDPLVKKSLEYIRHQKGKGKYPEDINIGPHSFTDEKQCLSFYLEYEQRKTEMLCLDFDDLVLKAIEVLKENPEAREYWSNRFSYLLIDEFQDTNDFEYTFIKLLCNPDTSITVVGDPDQTIYTWRGANQSIILRFPHEFSPCVDVVLDQNYRSTKPILDAANSLISFNKKRVPKKLYTALEGGDPIQVKSAYNAEDEARWVVEKIQSIADRNGGDYTKVAVLYRSSYATRPFEAAFAARRIPYRIFGGLRFYQRREVKDVLAYFRLLLNPKDNISFERIANVPKRSVGEATVDKIRALAEQNDVSEYELIANMEKYDVSSIPSKAITGLLSMSSAMEETKKKLTDNFELYSSVLRDFITGIGYYKYITEDQGIDEDRAGNVNALFDDITNFISKNPDSTFDEYLQNVTLLTSQDEINDGNYVSLMTVHTAKGLEFDTVFLICLNDGAFPSSRAVAEDDRDGLEEERRLCYVAFTRAKRHLYLTCNRGYSFTTDSRSIPSQFFKEAGIKVAIEQEDYRPSRPYGGYRKPNIGNVSSFFSDGDAISPFDEPKVEKPKPKPSNGVQNWEKGDRCHHEKFGDGEVVDVIDKSIIVVRFEDGSRKTLMSTHPMLSRIGKIGGQA